MLVAIKVVGSATPARVNVGSPSLRPTCPGGYDASNALRSLCSSEAGGEHRCQWTGLTIFCAATISAVSRVLDFVHRRDKRPCRLPTCPIVEHVVKRCNLSVAMISPEPQPPPRRARRQPNRQRVAIPAGDTTAPRRRTKPHISGVAPAVAAGAIAAATVTVPVVETPPVAPPAAVAPTSHGAKPRPAGGLLRSLARNRKVTAAGAVLLVAAVAAYVRFVGLSQVGFNSDEAVYSGQAAAIAGFQ